MKERATLSSSLADAHTRDALQQVVRPNSISKTLRKAGVALMLSPDPITDVPGAIMLGVSFATRNRQPLSHASVFAETRKVLAEMGSFT